MKQLVIKSALALSVTIGLSSAGSFIPQQAEAAALQPVKGTVTVSSLYLRTSASVNAKVLTVLKKNTVFTITRTTGSWSQISYNGKVGFLRNANHFVAKTSLIEKSASLRATVNVSSLTIRTKPSTSAPVAGYLTKGMHVDLKSVQGNWISFSYKGKSAYISADFTSILKPVTGTVPRQPAKSVPAKPSTNPIKMAYSSVPKLNVRQSPSLTGTVIGSLSLNQKVVIINYDKEWSKIKYDTGNGYVSSAFITLSKPEVISPSGRTYSVTGDVVTVYGDSSLTGSRIGHVFKHEKVQILSETEACAQIKFGTAQAYVSKQFLEPVSQTDSQLLKNVTIVLDPGHGGKDTGAIANNIYEKNLVLNVGMQVRDRLTSEGATVIMTREGDTYPTLSDRVKISNSSNAVLFVSIHANHSDSSRTRGIEVFYYKNAQQQYSSQLASHIEEELMTVMPDTTDRGIKTSDLYVNHYNQKPSVLVEIGFISNADDATYFKSSEGTRAVSTGIYNGILSYYQLSKK